MSLINQRMDRIIPSPIFQVHFHNFPDSMNKSPLKNRKFATVALANFPLKIYTFFINFHVIALIL